jgi:hypothetical protein
LPKGQAFALIEGGQLWKIRMPLPAPDPDEVMPKDLQAMAGYMRKRYVPSEEWWDSVSDQDQSASLPPDMFDDDLDAERV